MLVEPHIYEINNKGRSIIKFYKGNRGRNYNSPKDIGSGSLPIRHFESKGGNGLIVIKIMNKISYMVHGTNVYYLKD